MSKNTPNSVSLDLLLEELAKFPAKDGKYTYNDIVYAASVVSRLPKPKKTTKTTETDDSKTSSDEAKVTWNEFKKKRNAELKDSIKDAEERTKKISEEWIAYKESHGIKTKAKSPKKDAKDEDKADTKAKSKSKAETKTQSVVEETKTQPIVETKVAELKAILNDMSDDDSEPNDSDEYADDE